MNAGKISWQPIIHPLRGAIAQLGERVVRNDEAVGSSPTSSTKFFQIISRKCLLPPCGPASHAPITGTLPSQPFAGIMSPTEREY